MKLTKEFETPVAATTKKKSNGKCLSVSREEFMKVYDGIRNGCSWTYGGALKPEFRHIADEYVAKARDGKEINENEWLTFCLCIQLVKEINF